MRSLLVPQDMFCGVVAKRRADERHAKPPRPWASTLVDSARGMAARDEMAFEARLTDVVFAAGEKADCHIDSMVQ
ncbi:hypothetical protein O988_03159 [Pseudogymnoascus sp. VKM F-3808]|nr:hypothetical protein O988_03159 [Pseudogymnoascus sp. VKM F-3808]